MRQSVRGRHRGCGSTPDRVEDCNRPEPLALRSDKDRTIDKTWISGFRSAPAPAEPVDGIARRAGCSPASLSPDISFAVLPIRRQACFKQAVFQGQIGDHLLERCGLAPQSNDLVRGGGPGRIASQALLASLQEVFRPAIVQVLCDPRAATQLGNAVLAAQAFQYDPDLLLGRIMLARRPPDVLDDLLSRFLR